jgi:hypothetical protein
MVRSVRCSDDGGIVMIPPRSAYKRHRGGQGTREVNDTDCMAHDVYGF